MSNRFQQIIPGSDVNQQIAQINKNFGELDNENVRKLYFDSNGVPSIQIGVQADGSSRIRIAKNGVDVTTATDDQLSFNSARDTMAVLRTNTATMNINFAAHGPGGSGQDTTSSVGETFSYDPKYGVPAVMAYASLSTSQIFPIANGTIWTNSFSANSWSSMYFLVNMSADGISSVSLNIAFRQNWATNASGNLSAFNGVTFNIKYYILQQTAL